MGRTVGKMRKTFTLVLASVLATGAVQVANADTFTVIDDPESYISIGQITKPWGPFDSGIPFGALDEAEAIVPVPGDYLETEFTSVFHRLPLEVKRSLGDRDLDHVAVCFYDSLELTAAADVVTHCGDGTEQNPELPLNPWNAAPLAITSIANLDSEPATDPVLVRTAGSSDPEYPRLGADRSAGFLSEFSLSDSFNGETVATDSVLVGSISFRLTDSSFNSAGWKVRVLAKYTGEGVDPVILELESTRLYTVAYLGSLTNSREAVDYRDVLPGGGVTQVGIQTTNYRANNTSDITLTATAFGELTFGSSALPAADEVSLSCKPNDAETFDNFFTAGNLSTMLLSEVQNVRQAQLGGLEQITADLHDCSLHVGSGVATGVYTNEMTVGIGATP